MVSYENGAAAMSGRSFVDTVHHLEGQGKVLPYRIPDKVNLPCFATADDAGNFIK